MLTNRSAASLDDAIQLIDWNRAHWETETLFNILKNACRVEALQLSAAAVNDGPGTRTNVLV
ncbi:hypothetical protein KB879_00090 [Cupriavidus sp. KK10]|jgi:hypothetical protein|nr:hypothetical protein KB879_00090 [Cupriavidus sp. KK10]